MEGEAERRVGKEVKVEGERVWREWEMVPNIEQKSEPLAKAYVALRDAVAIAPVAYVVRLELRVAIAIIRT